MYEEQVGALIGGRLWRASPRASSRNWVRASSRGACLFCNSGEIDKNPRRSRSSPAFDTQVNELSRQPGKNRFTQRGWRASPPLFDTGMREQRVAPLRWRVRWSVSGIFQR